MSIVSKESLHSAIDLAAMLNLPLTASPEAYILIRELSYDEPVTMAAPFIGMGVQVFINYELAGVVIKVGDELC